MEALAQQVRASDCGSEGRGFEPHMPPIFFEALQMQGFFYCLGKNSLIVVPMFLALLMLKIPSTTFSKSLMMR